MPPRDSPNSFCIAGLSRYSRHVRFVGNAVAARPDCVSQAPTRYVKTRCFSYLERVHVNSAGGASGAGSHAPKPVVRLSANRYRIKSVAIDGARVHNQPCVFNMLSVASRDRL